MGRPSRNQIENEEEDEGERAPLGARPPRRLGEAAPPKTEALLLVVLFDLIRIVSAATAASSHR